MAAKLKKITNLKTLQRRHLKGEALTKLAAEAKPEAVDYRTLQSSFRRTITG